MKHFLFISLLLLFTIVNAIEVVNFGVPGLTVKGVSGSRLNKIISHKANLAVIMLGREEMRNPKKLLSPEKLLIDYTNMLKSFKHIGSNVLIINILPASKKSTSIIDKNIIQANKYLQELAKKENIPIVDIHKVVLTSNNKALGEYLTKKRFTALDSLHLAKLCANTIKNKFPKIQKIICIGGEEVYGYTLKGAGTNNGETFPAQLQNCLNNVEVNNLLPQAGQPMAGSFASRAKWIWYPENFLQKRNVTKVFRKSFTLKELPISAKFVCSGDDKAKIFINGKLVKEGSWKPSLEGNITKHLLKGKNVIAIEVLNVAVDGGVIFRLDITFANGQSQEIVTDNSWKSFSLTKGATDYNFSEINSQTPWVIGDAAAFPWCKVNGFNYFKFLAKDEIENLKKINQNNQAKFSSIIKKLSQEKKVKYQVKYENSRAGIFDGKNFYPAMIYHTSSFLIEDYRTLNYLASMRDAGYQLYYLPMVLYNLWKKDNSIDFSTIEKRLLTLFSIVPNARIIIGLGLNPPEWYVKQNLAETVGYAQVGKEPTYQAKDQQRALRMSYASNKWRNDTQKIIKDIVTYLEKSPFSSRIFGYAPHCGVYNTEWHYFGMRNDMPDNGQAMTKEFRKFLREIYQNDVVKLQKSWKDNQVNFNNATVPNAIDRTMRPYGNIRVRSTNPKVLDYLACHQKVIGDTILLFNKTAKEACNYRALVGNYFGYVFEMNFPTEGWHLDNLRVLDSPYVDFQISPYGYGDFRVFGASGASRTMTTAYFLRNKLLIYEDDTRTHLNTVSGGHYANNSKESAALLMRGLSFALIDGCGIWMLEFNRGWYEDNLIKKMFKQMLHTRLNSKKSFSVSQVALVTDLESVKYHTYSDKTIPTLNKSLLDNTVLSLGNCSVPFDTVWMQDITKKALPDYKVYIFCNILKFTKERAQIIENLRKQGKTLIWLYAPGMIKDDEISLSSVKELTKFKVKMLSSRKDLQTIVAPGVLPDINKVYPIKARHRYNIKDVPVIVLDDLEAQVLGKAKLDDKEYPTLGLKKHGKGFSVIHTVPRIDKVLLSSLLKKTGVHFYLNDVNVNDVVFANTRFLAIHTANGGKRIVQLPNKAIVQQLYPDNKVISKSPVNSFTVVLPENSTSLFELK